ncbi:MAG: dihydropteroate synthase [Candidatus Rokuibacteriota bacterium]
MAAVKVLLEQALARARAAGIADEEIVLDPGIGFFRHEAVSWDEWDARVLAGLSGLTALGRPLGLGVSRKSFLGAITGQEEPARRLAGSLAATAVAVLEGAALIRTHDVADTVDAVRVAERLRRARVVRTS